MAEGAYNREKAIQALLHSVCLTLRYDNLPREVEVHTVGVTRAGRSAMSCYQVGGHSNGDSGTRWRLMCFDECFTVGLSDRLSDAPRPEYKKQARALKQIDIQVPRRTRKGPETAKPIADPEVPAS